MKFRISEKYRLEIRWERVIYDREGIARLINCYLTGPVLKEVEEMNATDYMDLDFRNQYIALVKSYYIARFSWNGVRRSSDRIYLSNVLLSNRCVNSVPELNDTDYILVDTKDHENDGHFYNLVYKSYLLKESDDLYKFGDN